jgi:hypothetical protein
VAQEDHARRAVLAALEVQQRVREEPALHAPLRGASFSTSMEAPHRRGYRRPAWRECPDALRGAGRHHRRG